MFALVEDGSITKMLSGNRGITIGSNQYPKAIFTLWTKSEREAIGIYEVIWYNTNKKDEKGTLKISNQLSEGVPLIVQDINLTPDSKKDYSVGDLITGYFCVTAAILDITGGWL